MSKNNIDWYKGLYEDLYKNHKYEGDTSFKFSMSMLFDNDSDGYIDVESFEDGVNLLDVVCCRPLSGIVFYTLFTVACICWLKKGYKKVQK